tara:strand:- start:866 stop:1198 length:333 start_codon:yes stop_codon:yes gene_type:complete
MKLTGDKLKELIKESVEADEELLAALKKLNKGIDNLDLSIDYLAAAFTGEAPLSIGMGQKIMGRYRLPAKERPRAEMRENTEALKMEEYIKQIIDEELEKVLNEHKTRRK